MRKKFKEEASFLKALNALFAGLRALYVSGWVSSGFRRLRRGQKPEALVFDWLIGSFSRRQTSLFDDTCQ